MSALQVRQFPCLSDNYGFLIHDPDSGETACIDSPDPAVILAECAAAGWSLSQIWNTHHHHDHAGGNTALIAATGARVIGPSYDVQRIPTITEAVSDGDLVHLGSKTAEVWFTPGHTIGHICFVFHDEGKAFVGDTLFALGCGRMFEGTPEQMWGSLARLTTLPDETQIYCAHEYTQANAGFALSIDPDNRDLQAYAMTVEAERARGEPTVPTTIGAEIAANPFLRVRDRELRKRLDLESAADSDVFAEIRRRKDQF
jgi:hydroxyacylglutathione hydrolase